MANEWSATIVLPKVVPNVTWFVEKHAAVLVHTLEVKLILLGLGIKVLVNLVPLWGNTVKLFVGSATDQWGFCFAHLIDHVINLLKILCSIELADGFLGSLRLKLVVTFLRASALVAAWSCLSIWIFYLDQKWSLGKKWFTSAFLGASWWGAGLLAGALHWCVALGGLHSIGLFLVMYLYRCLFWLIVKNCQ